VQILAKTEVFGKVANLLGFFEPKVSGKIYVEIAQKMTNSKLFLKYFVQNFRMCFVHFFRNNLFCKGLVKLWERDYFSFVRIDSFMKTKNDDNDELLNWK